MGVRPSLFMRSFLLKVSLVLAAAALSSYAHAQDILPATEYVAWSAEARPSQIPPGKPFSVVVRANIDEGWKMYALNSPRPSYAVTFSWDDLPADISSAGEMSQNEPISDFDPYFETDVKYFTGSARFTAPFEVAPDATEGSKTIFGTARFMICNATLCLPPTPVSLSADVTVDAQAAPDLPGEGGSSLGEGSSSLDENAGSAEGGSPGTANEDAFAAPSSDLTAAREGGFWAFVLIAVGAGLAALLTPCVFPMIPLTVSYFTKHSDSRGESVRMAIVYGASIVVTFTALGALTAVFVGAAGAQTIAANPWINLFIGVIFVVFALSLLGLFELRLPNGLLNFFNRQSAEKKGYLGVLFMGLTLTLVSFSCTAPFVGGLLAATASNEWAYPITGMLAFSATFSLPFVIFALFPNALTRLPRSGSWMNTVKVVLGFVELAAALKFLSNADLIWGWGLISRPLAIALAVVIFGLTGLYLLGKVRLSHEPPLESVGVVRLLFSVAFLGLSLYLLPGLFGAPLNALDAYLPPRQATDVSLLSANPGDLGSEGAELPWIHDIQEAFETARAENKPVFVDFTGYTCTNCRQMEANVFPRPSVAERLKGDFVLLRLYTDAQDRGPELQRYQLRLTGTVALPTYAVVDPRDGSMIARKTGMATAEQFASFLERGAAAYREDVVAAR